MGDFIHLDYSVSDSIATITLNRPERLNALNMRLRYEIIEALTAAGDDANVRAVVLRGAGRAFCSGDDLRSGSDELPPRSQRKDYADVLIALRHLPKPVVVAVHGYAYGAGCLLALASDFCLAQEGCQFALPFVLRGLVAGAYLALHTVGLRRAADLLITGRSIDADTALRWGLINNVVAADSWDDAVAEFARELAQGPTNTIGLIKRSLNEALAATLIDGLNFERYANADPSHAHDREEGRRAFAEKRDPQFTYRG